MWHCLHHSLHGPLWRSRFTFGSLPNAPLARPTQHSISCNTADWHHSAIVAPLLLCPCRRVQHRPVLWAEKETATRIPKVKDYIITAERTKTLGYIAKAWAHYNIALEGPPLSWIMYRVSVNVPKQSQTTLQCALNGAPIVPVNDTRTQCTTLTMRCGMLSTLKTNEGDGDKQFQKKDYSVTAKYTK